MPLKESISEKPWTAPDHVPAESLTSAGPDTGNEDSSTLSPTDPLLWAVLAVIAVGSLGAMTLWGWTIAWKNFGIPVGVSVSFLVLGWASTGRSAALARTGYAEIGRAHV